MVTLTQYEQDMVDRFRQLPPERRRHLMQVMYHTDADRWSGYQNEAESRLRALATERGLDWDKLDDEQRQDFVNDLVHESRS